MKIHVIIEGELVELDADIPVWRACGHPKVGRNVFHRSDGYDECRACRRRHTRNWRAKKKAGQGVA